VGRNDACPCGSGKKYKDCHEREGSVYLDKLAIEQERGGRARAEEPTQGARLDHCAGEYVGLEEIDDGV
jgi:hypothetical protein